MSDVLELESAIKTLPGVLGCVIMTDPQGAPSEIQAFVRAGVDQSLMQQAIREEVARRRLDSVLHQVFVFELDAESHFGDRETLQRAAELAEQDARSRGRAVAEPVVERPARRRLQTRPVVERVVLTSSSWSSESEVALRLDEAEYVGTASGDKTPHGLKVLAQATLDAVEKLNADLRFRLEGASLVTLAGREAVLVLVIDRDGLDTVGAALVRGAPLSEATVRATLAAINRRLGR